MESHSQLSPSVRFGPFELDVRSAELRYNGHTTLLHEQPFQVLLALLERPGELISREELVHRLWPDGTFVDYERGLNKAVNKLRDILRDSADSPRFVETIPRRGYRFIAPLEGGTAPVNGSSGMVAVETGTQRKVWLAIGAAVTLALIAAAVYGGYSLSGRKHSEPFENFTISQITNTGKVGDAAISPDGKFLLSTTVEGGKQSLWLRNIATNSDTQLTPPSDASYSSLAFSPDGNYIYFRKLHTDWFDLLRAPVLGGSPQVVVRNIDGDITFSPGGKRMAYVRMNDPEVGKFQVLTANADGTDEKMLAGGRLHDFLNAVAWSPDGKQIASAIPGLADALGGIQLVDATTAKTQMLGQFNKRLLDMTWFPDGHGLLATYPSTPLFGRVQVGFMSNPGGQFRNITNDTNSYGRLTLSADGKTLVTVQQKNSQTLYLLPAAGFAGQPPNPAPAQNKDSFWFGWASNRDLYFDGGTLLRVSIDGRNKTTLLSDPTGGIMMPVSCRNGYVLLLRPTHDGGNKLSTWRVDADGSNPKQLTDGTLDGGHQCSPDSKWAYYYDFDAVRIKRVPVNGGASETVPGTVIPQTYIGSTVVYVSPDGKLLAFLVAKLEPTGPTRIALVNLDAGPEPPSRMLDPNPRISGWVGFTPDGKSLLYPINENGVENLWRQPLDGSSGRQITHFQSDGIVMFEFSPDGKILGVLRSHAESDVVLLRDTGSSPQ